MMENTKWRIFEIHACFDLLQLYIKAITINFVKLK